jgi:hypothetical protein
MIYGKSAGPKDRVVAGCGPEITSIRSRNAACNREIANLGGSVVPTAGRDGRYHSTRSTLRYDRDNAQHHWMRLADVCNFQSMAPGSTASVSASVPPHHPSSASALPPHGPALGVALPIRRGPLCQRPFRALRTPAQNNLNFRLSFERGGVRYARTSSGIAHCLFQAIKR